MVASFIPLGTLVDAGLPSDPVAVVAAELRERGVPVPPDPESTCRGTHVDASDGAEVPSPARVPAALGIGPGVSP